jgi:zinc transport system permease protein
MGGLLGSFTILRQLSFFSDALGHSALLGISVGLLLGLNLSMVLLPFAVIFALVVTYLLERTQLWTDALLNVMYSSSLAIAIITLSFAGQYKGGIHHLLFGDILAVQSSDLVVSFILLLLCVVYIGLPLRTQMSSSFCPSSGVYRVVVASGWGIHQSGWGVVGEFFCGDSCLCCASDEP